MIELAAMIAGARRRFRSQALYLDHYGICHLPLKLCTQSTLIMRAATATDPGRAVRRAHVRLHRPMTMAGTLAQLHAEQMAGITICQLTHPGPRCSTAVSRAWPTWTMGYLGGGVECGMMNAAIHQLAPHIKVPNYNSSGLSDAKLPDAQAGWEKAMTSVLAAMGGSNYCTTPPACSNPCCRSPTSST